MPLTMLRRSVTFDVIGIARPQGSMRAFLPKGSEFPVVTHNNANSTAWRHRVAESAKTVADEGLFVGPVALEVTFHLPRPKALARRVRHHLTKPDLDKLVRCVKDGLTGILYHDDSQVVDLTAHKVYAPIASSPHAVITVAEADDPEPEPVDLFV
jgi:Holliday junction resolvase RusA-like endonuclease